MTSHSEPFSLMHNHIKSHMGKDGMVLMESLPPTPPPLPKGSPSLISVKNGASSNIHIFLTFRGICLESAVIPPNSTLEFHPHGNHIRVFYFSEKFPDKRSQLLKPGDHITLCS